MEDVPSQVGLTPAGGGGGGGGGTTLGDPPTASMRYSYVFEFDERPDALRIANESGSVDRTVDVITAPRAMTGLSFAIAKTRLTPSLVDAVWRSGAGRDPVPERIELLEAEWFDSSWGPTLPVAVEKWSGCDVVYFRVGDPERYMGLRPGRIDMIDGSGSTRVGVPHGGGSGAGGIWARMAYPTD